MTLVIRHSSIDITMVLFTGDYNNFIFIGTVVFRGGISICSPHRDIGLLSIGSISLVFIRDYRKEIGTAASQFTVIDKQGHPFR